MRWLIGVVVLVAAELAALIEVAHAIGAVGAVLLLVLVSASGPWLVRRAGLGVWRRTRDRVASGLPPGPEALDGAALFVGGVLVCVPGFITDVVGLALLLPPVRLLARRLLLRHFTRRLQTGGPVIDVASHPSRPGGSSPSPSDHYLEPPP